MQKYFILNLLSVVLLFSVLGCSEIERSESKSLVVGDRCVSVPLDAAVMDLSAKVQKSETSNCEVSLVKLSGKVNHFGYDITTTPPSPIPYAQNVAGVKVWVAEYPITKYFNIKSNDAGYWTMWVIKEKGVNLDFSFVYEKEGWVTTKSNIITITDADDTDLAIQMIDPVYYYYAVKPGIENQLSMYLGFPITISNGIVVTVGKSWASLYDPVLPHGDAGATAILSPLVQAIGPIYFDETAQPNPTYTSTSMDGGVVWLNVPFGIYNISASKAPYQYSTVRFNISQDDQANNVVLYIASPPDSVQGTNSSGPGEL